MRYAILFSGMTERRGLNGLEFSYRALIEHFGYDPVNIHVLTYDGSLRTCDDGQDEAVSQGPWPGDGMPFRLKVTGEGSRDAFRHALQSVGRFLTEEDSLFISVNGHGGNYGDGRGPFLIAYPRRMRYWVADFCADLSDLPPHGALVTLMAQCFSGDFNEAVLRTSKSKKTFIASASTRYSYAMPGDLNWDSFARNWLAALTGSDVDGRHIPCCGAPGAKARVTVHEAFVYAMTCPSRNAFDLPSYAASPRSACDLTLLDETDSTTVLQRTTTVAPVKGLIADSIFSPP